MMPLVALGVLSTISSFGCQHFLGRTRCRTVPAIAARRRQRLRAELRRSTPTTRRSVEMRFLVAGACGNTSRASSSCSPPESYMRGASAAEQAVAWAEAAAEGDMLLLGTAEDPLGGCSRKYVIWFERALRLFPRAAFVGLADDDVYIQFSHFAADLDRFEHEERQSSDELVLWGFIFWRPWYNRATMAVAEGVDYETHDASVSKHRYRLERCAWERRRLARHPSRASSLPSQPPSHWTRSRLDPGTREQASRMSAQPFSYCAVLNDREKRSIEKDEISPLPPLPIINGPLFAVSAPLARILAPMGHRWLDDFKQTKLVQWARTRHRIPYRLRDVGCWPFGDATLGLWAGQLAHLPDTRPITLVDTPKFVSHHPSPSLTRGAFGNSSIVLHGLKDAETDEYWSFALRRGSGPYEPPGRTCDTCRRQGWVTFPGSPLQRWRCCGSKVKRRPMRTWPRTVLQGMAISDAALRSRRHMLRARGNSSLLSDDEAEQLLLSRIT